MHVPRILRPLWNAWMAFSRTLGRMMSTVILTVLWVVGFGPYAVVFAIMRLLKPCDEPPGTWHALPPPDPDALRHPF